MERIVRILQDGEHSCVIANGAHIGAFERRGVADLLDMLHNNPEFLRGASVADKVVGKAAAALLITGGVKAVYAEIISRDALELLRDAGIETSYGKEVRRIENRFRTGLCPLEKCCVKTMNAAECVSAVEEFMRVGQG